MTTLDIGNQDTESARSLSIRMFHRLFSKCWLTREDFNNNNTGSWSALLLEYSRVGINGCVLLLLFFHLAPWKKEKERKKTLMEQPLPTTTCLAHLPRSFINECYQKRLREHTHSALNILINRGQLVCFAIKINRSLWKICKHYQVMRFLCNLQLNAQLPNLKGGEGVTRKVQLVC